MTTNFGFRGGETNGGFGVTTKIGFRARAGFRVHVKKPFLETDTIKRGLGFPIGETDTIKRADEMCSIKGARRSGVRGDQTKGKEAMRCAALKEAMRCAGLTRR